jgi:hypothetical protein
VKKPTELPVVRSAYKQALGIVIVGSVAIGLARMRRAKRSARA